MGKELYVEYDLLGEKKVSLRKIAAYYKIPYDRLLYYYTKYENVYKAINSTFDELQSEKDLTNYIEITNYDLNNFKDKIGPDEMKKVYKILAKYVIKNNNYDLFDKKINDIKYIDNKKEIVKSDMCYYTDSDFSEAEVSREELELMLIEVNTDKRDCLKLKEYSAKQLKLFNILFKLLDNSDIDYKDAIEAIRMITPYSMRIVEIVANARLKGKLILKAEELSKLMEIIDSGYINYKLNKELIEDFLIFKNRRKSNKKNIDKKNKEYKEEPVLKKR